MRVEVEQQVLDFIASLPPEPRRSLRRAIRQLANWRGDIRQLEGPLEGFYRIRIQRYRIIFFVHQLARRRTIRCVYAAPRNIVYEIFARQLTDLLRERAAK